MSKPLSLPLALTMGDPAGIGPEITIKAWRMRVANGLPPFFAIADPDCLKRAGHTSNTPISIAEISAPSDANEAFSNALPVLPISLEKDETPGVLESVNAQAVMHSIDMACDFALQGKVAGIVTNPIHKRTLYEAGLTLPGHTEYLAERTGGATPVMMLSCTGLRVVPVTVHLGLKDAIAALTTDLIVEKGTILAGALKRDLGITSPRIAVSALNPHAGEDGHFGNEEALIIEPAIVRLKSAGIDAMGPWSADTLFHEAARARYDAAICMYHDQALIPVKTLGFEEGVNTTLGLSIIRTSPDHGTALDIAGKGLAHAGSLIAAIKLANEMSRHRARG